MGSESTSREHRDQMAWALSGHQDPDLALHHVLEQLHDQLGGGEATFGFMFVSESLAMHASRLAVGVTRGLETEAIIGCSARSVIGGRATLHEHPGLAVLAGRVEGATARAFELDASEVAGDDEQCDTVVRERASVADQRGAIVLADPATLATSRPVDRIAKCVPTGLLTGGLVAGKRGLSVQLIHGARAREGGLVGISFGGEIRLDPVVAQGARPVGMPLVVTKAHRNLIQQLGGRPAIDVIREVAQGFTDRDRHLLAPGLYLGLVVDEYRERFGRGDFAVRKIVGGHEQSGSIAIDAEIRAGRTVQVHLLDPELARGDLSLLLDAQKLHSRPLGGLLLADVARGPQLFGDEWSDAIAVARAFDDAQTGVDAAKVGYEIAPHAGPIPLAGCLVGAELAPGGGRVRSHALAACLTLFRKT